MIFPGRRNRIVKRFSFACQGALLLTAALTGSAPAQVRQPTATVDAFLHVRSLNDGESLLPQAPSESKVQQEKQVEAQEQSQRTLGIVPGFSTTDRMDARPLTPGGKFRLFAKKAFDPVTVAVAAAQAGLSQADNQFAGYGQGAEGYRKRFGAAFADKVSAGFFRNFAYATIFNQDPRYFRRGHGGFGRRFVYSLLQEVVCHTDRGGRTFNSSTMLGAISSGALSNAYYPADDRGFKLLMSRTGLVIAYRGAGNLLNEFWPDIQRKIFKNK